MNLIQIQLESIRRALGFIGYSKPKRIIQLESIRRALGFVGYSKPKRIVATPETTQIEVIQERDLDRERPQQEMVRERENPYDDPGYIDKYAWQYGSYTDETLPQAMFEDYGWGR